MASTVIDSLVVLLGLDASNYKKGRETAEKETSETARKAKESADAITKSLTEVGRTIAGLFLGFESASGFGKWLRGLNSGEAALGRVATNIGLSAHELNKWGLAVAQVSGSTAQDAQAAFVQLTDEAQKFFVTGEASPLINTLRQYGVALKDSSGHLRNQGEILEELADKTAVYGHEYQNFAFKQAGLSQGEINYLTQSKKLREDELRLAEQNNNVNDDSVRKAQELERYWSNIRQQVEAVGQAILSDITPALKSAFAEVSKLMGAFKDSGGLTAVGNAISGIGNAVKSIFNGWKLILDLLNSSSVFRAWDKYVNWFTGLIGKGLAYGAGDNAGTVPAPSGSPPVPLVGADAGPTYRNHNPGNLRPYKAGQPTDSRGFRKFGTDAEGAQALEDDLRAKMREGLNSVSQILDKYAPASENNTQAYKDDVSKRLGVDQDDPITEAQIKQLARAITIHEDAIVRAKGGGATAGNTTTVQVDAIHVTSNSADPRAVADQVGGAIQRKVTVSQSDTGQS
jgi:hypothetical protein